MGVYIKGIDLPKEVGNVISINIYDKKDNWLDNIEIYRKDIIEMDIVRCGECKHKPIKHDPEGDDFGFNLVSPNGYDNLCPCLNTDDGFYSYMPEDNFFCAFGERRSDE